MLPWVRIVGQKKGPTKMAKKASAKKPLAKSKPVAKAAKGKR
jgi:hypothetical protein